MYRKNVENNNDRKNESVYFKNTEGGRERSKSLMEFSLYEISENRYNSKNKTIYYQEYLYELAAVTKLL